jgi:Flp pilus assembly CpaE family ATPase
VRDQIGSGDVTLSQLSLAVGNAVQRRNGALIAAHRSFDLVEIVSEPERLTSLEPIRTDDLEPIDDED